MKFGFPPARVGLYALFALSLAWPQPSHAQTPTIGTSRQPLVFTNAGLWTQNNRNVPMCWHESLQFPSAAAANDAKVFVRSTIEDGWISLLRLNITWTDCPSSGAARHVRVKLRIGDAGYNGTTKVAGMGTLSNAAERLPQPPNDAPGLLMGFPSNWNTNDATRARFRSLILHEFGHILGFDHEQIRPDGPAGVACYSNPVAGATRIGPPDPQSIMGWSYCTQALGVLTLSDIRGARSLYGRGDRYTRGVMLTGRFRTQRDLNGMSGDGQRNTLIVELAGRSSQTGAYFQSLDDTQLAGAGAVLVFLREAGIRNDADLRRMSIDDMRNVLIVELHGQTGRTGPALQGMTNIDLVLLGLGSERSYIRGMLMAGRFRTYRQLNAMNPDGHRNTLITELAGRTRPGSQLQALNDEQLAGAAGLLVFLREARLRSDQELRGMSVDDLRNTTIVALGVQTSLDRQLQSLSNMDLIRMLLGRMP